MKKFNYNRPHLGFGSEFEFKKMENITTLLNTTVISVKSVAYTIRHYDRIDTFCDSKELGSEFSHFLICGLLQSVIHFMGTFTNFFSILVLRKPDSHSAFYVFLLALFSCDTLILVLNGIFFILPQLLKYVGTLPTFSYIVAPIAAQYAYPLVNMGVHSIHPFLSLGYITLIANEIFI